MSNESFIPNSCKKLSHHLQYRNSWVISNSKNHGTLEIGKKRIFSSIVYLKDNSIKCVLFSFLDFENLIPPLNQGFSANSSYLLSEDLLFKYGF